MCVFGFFFFKQKTAYEMRISDWSSDVCSSDLAGPTVTKASLLQAVLPSMPDAAQAAANWQGIDLQLLFECCVDLGFEAADTAGNALETAGWLNAHGYKSIRLVTANYHMPRSLVEFSRRLPGITIVPPPVLPDRMRVDGRTEGRRVGKAGAGQCRTGGS